MQTAYTHTHLSPGFYHAEGCTCYIYMVQQHNILNGTQPGPYLIVLIGSVHCDGRGEKKAYDSEQLQRTHYCTLNGSLNWWQYKKEDKFWDEKKSSFFLGEIESQKKNLFFPRCWVEVSISLRSPLVCNNMSGKQNKLNYRIHFFFT